MTLWIVLLSQDNHSLPAFTTVTLDRGLKSYPIAAQRWRLVAHFMFTGGLLFARPKQAVWSRG